MKAKKVKKTEYVWQCDKCKSEYSKETEAEDCCINIRALKYGCCFCGTRHTTREKEEACCKTTRLEQHGCPLPGQSCYDCHRRTL